MATLRICTFCRRVIFATSQEDQAMRAAAIAHLLKCDTRPAEMTIAEIGDEAERIAARHTASVEMAK